MSLTTIALNYFRIATITFAAMILYYPAFMGLAILMTNANEMMIKPFSFAGFLYYIIFSFLFSVIWAALFYLLGALIDFKKSNLFKLVIIFTIVSIVHSVIRSSREIKNFGLLSEEVLINEIGTHWVALFPFIIIFYFLYRKFGVDNLRSLREEPIIN